MYYRAIPLVTLVVLLYCHNVVADSGSAWQLISDKDGISVYQQNVKDSDFHAFKGTVTLNSGLRKTVAFLQDENRNTQWVPYSGGVTLLDRPEPRQSIVHFVLEGRWPFADRDAITLFEIEQQQDLTLTITMTNLPDYLPEKPDRIRMQTYEGFWRLTPIDANTTQVVYQSHVDPGGSVPAWLANRMALETTRDALQNLRNQIVDYQNPEAVNGRLRFIRELPTEQKESST